MKIFVTLYALSNGIEEVDAELTSQAGMMRESGVTYPRYFHQKAWKPTREEAVADAEGRRLKKIRSLNEQISKLEKLTFR